MVKPYSQDLRERVMSAVDGGTSVAAAAPLSLASISYIYKALARRQATGETTARSGGAPEPKLAAHGEALRQRIARELKAHRRGSTISSLEDRPSGICRSTYLII
jgi:transposase